MRGRTRSSAGERPVPIRRRRAPEASVVDLAMAPDAIVDPRRLERPRAGAAGRDVPLRDPAGRRSIEVLPAGAASRSRSRSSDGSTGERVPGRVRFTAADGRYLPPVGHRDEVNPGFYEDTGADLVLGSSAYAYVPGRFAIELPVGAVEVEVVGGFDRAPHRARLEIDPSTRRLELPLDRTIDLHAGRWVTARQRTSTSSRPSTALLQAAAEDVDLVNLLADPVGRPVHERDRPAVGLDGRPVGSPDRGRRDREPPERARPPGPARRPPAGPSRSPARGPPEGRMAGALSVLLADWADRCRAAGGSSSRPTSRCRTRRSRPTSSPARSTRSRRRRSRPGSTTRRSSSGTASSTSATGCRSWPGPTRCRPRSRSARSGPTVTCRSTTRSRSNRGRRPSEPAGPSSPRVRSSS